MCCTDVPGQGKVHKVGSIAAWKLSLLLKLGRAEARSAVWCNAASKNKETRKQISGVKATNASRQGEAWSERELVVGH